MIIPKINSWRGSSKAGWSARLRLFCFPYAGGSTTIYHTWPNDLPADIEVRSIQIPRREGRPWEPLFDRLEPLVQVLVQTLRPHLNMPYAFFGHSLGALICFELARTLVQQGASGPVHLFVSGHSAPQIQCTSRLLHRLPDSEFIQEIKRLNGTPPEVLHNAELMELFLPALRADVAINETYAYTPGTPLDCPISAFGGLQDRLTNHASLAAWRDQAHGAFSLHMFPGDHFFLQHAQEPLLRTLLQDLTHSLSSRLTPN